MTIQIRPLVRKQTTCVSFAIQTMHSLVLLLILGLPSLVNADTPTKLSILSQNNSQDKVALIEINDAKNRIDLKPGYGASEVGNISVIWLINSGNEQTNSILKFEKPAQANSLFDGANTHLPLDVDRQVNLATEKQGLPDKSKNPEMRSDAGTPKNNSDELHNYSDPLAGEHHDTLSGSENNNPSNNESSGLNNNSFPPPPNLPPIAIANPAEFTVMAGNIVILNGSQSYDPEHSTLTYQWAQIEGPSVAIINPNSAISQFMAPDQESQLVFGLTVSDLTGLNASIYINVTVETTSEAQSYNSEPMINQGSNISLSVISSQIGSLELSAQDFDAAPNSLLWSLSTSPNNGIVYFSGNLSQTSSSSNDPIEVYYESDLGFSGSDSFVVRVVDDQDAIAEILVTVSVGMASYVDDDGPVQPGYNVSDPLGTEHHPFSSLEDGLVNLSSGGILYLQSGNYDWTSLVGYIDRPITIEGVGVSKPLISLNTEVILNSQASGSRFKNFDLISDGYRFLSLENSQTVNQILIEGVYFSGISAVTGLMDAGDLNTNGSNQDWVIRNCSFICNRIEYACITLSRHSNLLIENNYFTHSNTNITDVSALGIQETQGNIVIRANIFAKAGGNAIHIENSNYGLPDGNLGHLFIVNNTFYGMQGGGSDYYTGVIYESQMDETIINNLFIVNEGAAIHRWNLLSGYNTNASWVDYNLYFNNNGTSDDSFDDVTDNSPMFPRYTINSFQSDKGPDVDPRILSETSRDPNYLKFLNSSPAASGAYNGNIAGYDYPVLTKNGEAFFGAQEPVD